MLFNVVEVTDGSVQQVAIPRMHLTNGELPALTCNETFVSGLVVDSEKTSFELGKRWYKCKNCSRLGHNERGCKLFKPITAITCVSAHVQAYVSTVILSYIYNYRECIL